MMGLSILWSALSWLVLLGFTVIINLYVSILCACTTVNGRPRGGLRVAVFQSLQRKWQLLKYYVERFFRGEPAPGG